MKTKIEWATYTFNPWWGCVNVSPACDHCYAESLSNRWGFKIWGKDSPRRFFGDAHWNEPKKWNRLAENVSPKYPLPRVFCGSMCDVMEERDDLRQQRARLYHLIEDTPSLIWMLLTKRPQNFNRFLPQQWLDNPLRNVWLMTTVESPDYYWRIDALRNTPATIRGLSVEPLLAGMPTLSEHLIGIDWTIVGGESGHHARPMHPEWARSLRDQCRAAGVAYFFKQWGEWIEFQSEVVGYPDWLNDYPTVEVKQSTQSNQCETITLGRIGKKAAGRLLDGKEWNEVPQ